MKNFLQKKLNKKGFTLAELLIVVAIIGVLVAVSIPIFSTQLEKSRENTDIANMRAAKAAAIAMYLDNNEAAGVYWYDADGGALITNATEKAKMYHQGEYCTAHVLTADETLATYGKGNAKDGGCEAFKLSTDPDNQSYYRGNSNVKYGIIKVTISSNDAVASSENDEGVQDTVTLSWVGKTSAASSSKGDTTISGGTVLDELTVLLDGFASTKSTN